MTVIRKRTGDKGGCCDPISELQLEIERVDQTAIDAKTTANDTKAYLNTINGKVNEAIAVVPQVETNTENIAQHESRINANTTDINKNKIDIQEQGKDIAALKTKTNDNAAAIETLENEVGPETVAGTIQYRLKNIDTKLPTAIKEVEMIADASTVTHKSTHISGTTESDALPVVSREQAGIMSASVYAAMEDVIANNTSRISVLEQSAPTYDISGLVGTNPTNAEISAAFQQKYPNVPIQAGLRAADYDNAHFWQYGKNTWILLTQIDVQTATNQSLGIVKGSNTNGKVFVETDGSMSLKGYDALVSKDATHDSKIGTLETGLSNANARIDATNTNVANNTQDIATANGNISTNTNDINGLKNRMSTAEGQIATNETNINQHTQSINGLTTDVNGLKTDVNGLKTDVNGLKGRMTTAEGQIATNETNINQHTQSINGLTTDVNGLKTDVNGLKTSKQDKLIAGNGISIAADGKTISVSGGDWSTLNTLNDLGNYIKLKRFLSSGREIEITNNLRFDFITYNSSNYTCDVVSGLEIKKAIFTAPNQAKSRYSGGSFFEGSRHIGSCTIEVDYTNQTNSWNKLFVYLQHGESQNYELLFGMDFDGTLQSPSENIVLVSDFPSTLENGKVYVKAEVKL